MTGSADDPSGGHARAADLSDSGAQQLRETLCGEFVDRWNRGDRVPVEEYLEHRCGLDAEETVFELVLTEVVLREALGEPAPLDEFLSRFPQFEQRLRRHFALHEGLTALSPPRERPGSAGASVADEFAGVPGYEILEELGRGGMGVVYKARDAQLGRPVALKFLPPDYAQDGDRLERFLREARTASSLNHPYICTVHSLGEHEGRPFIVMEHVEGVTLRALVGRRPPLEDAVRTFRQVAQALAAAHARGVVHRDIKPENIMVRPDGYVKVLDFGLARRLPALTSSRPGGEHDTAPGALVGTVAYMSPEQARGAAAESASDVFCLGVVLYQVLTGRHPFESPSALEMLRAITADRPLTPSRLNPELPVALDALIERMLHKDPQLRPTATEIETALEKVARFGAAHPGRSPLRPVIHRERELAMLRTRWSEADAGRGSLICIAGEPGIGKTTLVEDFLDEVAAAGRQCLVARGHCSERLAGSEAYLPVLDALADLLRSDGTGTIARLMHAVAPTWYAHVCPAAAVQEAGATSHASSQQSMLREFCELFHELARLGPLVLFLDDIHWADLSTVDLLSHFGRACQQMRVLAVLTYRPTEMLLKEHPFHRVRQELQARGACTELSVSLLGRPDVDRYLTLLFPGHAFPPEFAELIYARTEGNPLFMADLLRYLREQGVLAQPEGRWGLARALPDLRHDLPESVRSMIQRQLERLDPDDLRLLAAASIQGHEFDSTVLAGALDWEAADVEERLQALDRVHGLVRLVREYEFPDRSPTLRYAFVHILYQQALYDELPPSRRSSLSAAIARTLQSHTAGTGSLAAELAYLYEVGRDFPSAARQFHLAARNAARVFAHHEAVALARRGLAFLQNVPDPQERASLELPLQTILGMQLQVTEGFAARAAREAYDRARRLCQPADAESLFPVLWGLWLYSKVSSDLARAQQMADELLMLARRLEDPDLALQSHQALGMTAFCRGRPVEAVAHVEQVAALYDPVRHRTHAFLFGQDPGVICKAYGAVALWLLGYADQAEQQSRAAIHMSRDLSPSSQAVALHFAAMLGQLRRDPARVRALTDQSTRIAVEHGFSFWRAGAAVLRGWAQAASGDVDEGLRSLRQGLHDWAATESVTSRTYSLGLLAEVLDQRGDSDEGRSALDEAITLARQTGEWLCEPELHRLRGESLLRRPDPDAPSQAEACFQHALTVARRQQALALELRAAISLARLRQEQARPAEARQLLSAVLDRVTEGFQTHDVRSASSILAQLS